MTSVSEPIAADAGVRHGVGAPDQPLNSLQAGRGIAAVMVVLLHAGVTVSVPKYWNVELFGGLFRAGSAGVEFFLVLSGFIIFWVHRRDIGVPSAFPRYAWRRAVRIYPIYWVVLTLMVAAKLAMPSFLSDVDTTAAGYVTSYALVGPHHAPILGVAWTLFHEMLFYPCSPRRSCGGGRGSPFSASGSWRQRYRCRSAI